MRAGIGQGNHAGLVLEDLRNAVVAHVEEVADEGGLQILLEAHVQEHVEGIAALVLRDVGDAPPVRSAYFSVAGTATCTRSQLPWKMMPRAGVGKAGAEAIAEARVLEHLLELLRRVGLDLAEGVVAEERVGVLHAEVERQRLARHLDPHRVAARLGGAARLEHAHGARRAPARCTWRRRWS